MNIILLSGGSGKRLWPLSNEVRSKQFLKIFRRKNGSYESMVQRMYRMICTVDQDPAVTIATSGPQVMSVKTQLGDAVDISAEPCRRDTFPAIALAAAYLHDVKGVSSDEPVVVCPVDSCVEEPYFAHLAALCRLAAKDTANLVLMGIEPAYPSQKYGYILPATSDPVTSVEAFREKPDRKTAEDYISRGGLWNAGVFAFKIGYILDIAEKTLGFCSHADLLEHYFSFPSISFDYAVAEKESRIQVLRFSGKWEDIGTWKTLTEAMTKETSGNAVAVNCKNTHVINELQIPLVVLGVDNLAIAATPDGILVADKNHSDMIKDYIPQQRPMCEKREWGEYRTPDYRCEKDSGSRRSHQAETSSRGGSGQGH